MKSLGIALLVTISFAGVGCSTQPIAGAVDRTDYIARGRADARRDLRAGKLAVETAGLPAPWQPTYAHLLRERYDIELRTVGGCVVTPDMDQHRTGYNEVMQAEITRRYGAKIFDRTAEEARRTGPTTYQ
jgi:hypothetical protein